MVVVEVGESWGVSSLRLFFLSSVPGLRGSAVPPIHMSTAAGGALGEHSVTTPRQYWKRRHEKLLSRADRHI